MFNPEFLNSPKFQCEYDSCDTDEGMTTMYFIVPRTIFADDEYVLAEEAMVSVEFPEGKPEAKEVTAVCVSPLDIGGQPYDWRDIELPYDEVEKLLVIGVKSQAVMDKYKFTNAEMNTFYKVQRCFHFEDVGTWARTNKVYLTGEQKEALLDKYENLYDDSDWYVHMQNAYDNIKEHSKEM